MSRSIPPSSEDVSVELTRAVLPTYLHHVLDASETLADFALERLAGNETARRELDAQIDAQRETCAAPVSIHKAAPERPGGPFARRDEALCPRAAPTPPTTKLADLSGARAANAEAGRSGTAPSRRGRRRGAPGAPRERGRSLDSGRRHGRPRGGRPATTTAARLPRAHRRGRRSGRSGRPRPGSQGASHGGGHSRMPSAWIRACRWSRARGSRRWHPAADAADALLSRAQRSLEEEAKLRGLLERQLGVNADLAASVRRSSSFRGDDAVVTFTQRRSARRGRRRLPPAGRGRRVPGRFRGPAARASRTPPRRRRGAPRSGAA